MKIAFFSKNLPSDEPNGVSVQVHRLAEALSMKRHSVTVYTLSPEVKNSRYRCITLKGNTGGRLSRKFLPAILFRGIDTSAYDIIHFHGDDYLCPGSSKRVRTFYGSALMEAMHAASAARFLYQALFYCLEWVSCIRRGTLTAISADTRKFLPMVRRVIPCCVPLERFHPDGEKSGNPSILFLGDLNSRKRGFLLLKAFSEVVLPALPECTLTVVGPVPCSGKNVRYAGRLDEERLIGEYRRNWVLCIPSSYEGFGVPIIEAMACGTAVLATHNAGSNALIIHGENGLLCTPENLGESLRELLYDGERRERIASAGRRFAVSFDSEVIARQYENLYNEILAVSSVRN